MKEDIVLYTKLGDVFVRVKKDPKKGIPEDFMVHICSEELVRQMEARDIILLVDLSIEEIFRQTVQ